MDTCSFYRLRKFDRGYVESINKLLSQLTSSVVVLTEGLLEEILNSDSSELYLMKCNDEVVGMFTLCFYATPMGRKCWLEDVVIDGAYRGRSFGKAMMRKIMDIVSEKGDTTLMLTSKPERIAANKLYKSSGLDIKETNVYTKFFD